MRGQRLAPRSIDVSGRDLAGFGPLATLDDAVAPQLTNLAAEMALPASPAYTLEWALSPSVPGKATCRVDP